MSLHTTKECYTEHLLTKKNVVGVGEGNGVIVVLVTQKEPLEALATEDVVEPELDGHPTDVIEVGRIEAHSHTNGLRPGASLGRQNQGGTGTLGCLVMHKGKLSLLSNNHVIAGSNSFPIGGLITNPGPADSSTRHVVARLTDFAPITFSTSASNRVDAAIAEITALNLVVGNDAIVSPIAASVSVGTPVVKTGRTTGTSTGSVTATNVSVNVGFGSRGSARFTGQILLTGMSSPGDSGSVIRRTDGRPVGLLFAGSTSSTVANPIGEVFDRFGLTLPDDTSEPAPDPGDVPPGDRPELRRGDSGPFVGLLQELLRSLGYSIDRFDPPPFGPQTEAAVRDFQGKQGLSVTGVVNSATWIRLENPQTPPSDPGGQVPPQLNAAKDALLARASGHGLAGLAFSGIAPANATAYGYHNSRARHLAGFTRDGTGDYSIQVPLDKEGNPLHFSALDLGSNNATGRATTRVITQRLREAVESGDPRVQYLREFYGSLDNSVVFGRSHNSLTGDWRPSSADNSHLWHVHLSFFRKFANEREVLEGIADIILGIPLEDPEPDPPESPGEPPESPGEPPIPPEEPDLADILDQLIPLLKELRDKLS